MLIFSYVTEYIIINKKIILHKLFYALFALYNNEKNINIQIYMQILYLPFEKI
jgi:hypothetical protein